MDKDAVSMGVKPVGGLFSTAEIKILICYILDTIGEPVPANELTNTQHYEGIAANPARLAFIQREGQGVQGGA